MVKHRMLKRMLCCLIGVILLAGCGRNDNVKLNVREEVIVIPELKKDYDLFFLADSHVTLCDKRDEALIEKNKARSESFVRDGKTSDKYFKALMKEARNLDSDLIVLGGDIIDSAMYSSIEFVKREVESTGIDYLYSTGNHDFEYGEEYFSPKAYEEYLPRLDDLQPRAFYEYKEYDDLVVFAVDDVGNQIDADAVRAFKEILQHGKPTLVVTHVPFEPLTGDLSLNEKCKEVWNPSSEGKSRVTMGFEGCYPNANTSEFIELMAYSDNVIGVLAGHIHFYHKDIFYNDMQQIVTGAAFEGDAIALKLRKSR